MQGFRTPERSGQVGVEIPYCVMTSLARIWYPVRFDGGIVLKGFSTILVPTACTANSVQWHYISNEKGGRLPTASFKEQIEKWHKFEQFEGMEGKRVFLGFCRKVKVLFGTREAAYDSVWYSRYTKKASRNLEIPGFTAGVAFPSHGLPGPTIATNFVFSKNQAITRSLSKQNYLNMLAYMKETPLILYDVDIKKSWLVPIISAVLHMLHIWARKRQDLLALKGSGVDIPFATSSWNRSQAAWEASLEKDHTDLKLHASPDVEPFNLMDLIKQIWGNLESAIERLDQQRPDGLRLGKRRKIRAWELMDMIITKPLSPLKEKCVKRTSGGWYSLTDDFVTLFCSGLGDTMVPDIHHHQRHHLPLCPGWSRIPSNKDYMIVSASALKDSSGTYGHARDEHIHLIAELGLFRRSKYVKLYPFALFCILKLGPRAYGLGNELLMWSLKIARN